MKQYNKYYNFFFSNIFWLKNIENLSEHFLKNKCAITHTSYKSPGKWQRNATYYLKVSENFIFIFDTKWYGNAQTIEKRFNECKKMKSTKKRIDYLLFKKWHYKHQTALMEYDKKTNDFKRCNFYLDDYKKRNIRLY